MSEAMHVSWLELERYALGELGAARRAEIAAALEASPELAACLAQITREAERPLPALSSRGPLHDEADGISSRLRRLSRSWASARMRARVSWPRWAAAAAGVAALVLLLRPPTRDAGPDLARAIKGGDLTAQLVRARGDEVAFDPTTFTTGDTFAVRVTCAFDAEVHFELAVFMGGEVFFPWKDGGRRGRCANMSVLRGSFLLSSEEPARVCVIMSLESIDRDRVQSDKERAYPETTLCKTLAPEK